MAKITNNNTKEINSLTTDIKVIMNDVSYIKCDIKEVKESLNNNDNKYVNKTEFNLVNKEQDHRIDKIEKLVYGAVGLGLVGIGKAVLDLVIISKASN